MEDFIAVSKVLGMLFWLLVGLITVKSFNKKINRLGLLDNMFAVLFPRHHFTVTIMFYGFSCVPGPLAVLTYTGSVRLLSYAYWRKMDTLSIEEQTRIIEKSKRKEKRE